MLKEQKCCTDMTRNEKGIETFAHKAQDMCSEAIVVSYIVTDEAVMNALRDLENHGGRFRLVVEITEDNIAACKEIMKIAEVRHLEGIMNTFTLNEKYYFGHVMQEPNGKLTQAILSNSKKYVDFQRYIFEALWKGNSCQTENKRNRRRSQARDSIGYP